MKRNRELSDDVAVIGLTYRFPHSKDCKGFWDLLMKGKDAIASIPEKRLEDIRLYSKYDKNIDIEKIEKGAYLDNIDCFDHAFFNISPSEALYMDPIQRVLLETSWHAFEDAGYTEDMVSNTKTGVFIGCSSEAEYKKIIQNMGLGDEPLSILGNCIPVIAGRISHCLNLKGPSMVVNTACSSSLVAVHLACRSLNEEECNLAIAGGIELRVIPYRYTKIGIESTSNITKSFDDDSDGTGSGEGAGVIVLKRFKEAIRDGDHIYCIIKGSAVNHDGMALNVSAPNPIAQESVLCAAWKAAGINPCDINFIEAHGTGTKLGDPIEVYALNRAFKKYTNKNSFCAIGSVKSNIGHLDSAAGIAGLVKAILCIHNKVLAPIANFDYPNTKIDFISSALYVNDIVRYFERDNIICGVSSFGLSGTNCHMILSSNLQNCEKQTNNNEKYGVFTISAKTRTALTELMREYIEWLENANNIHYLDICYTTNKRRNHYKQRFACVIHSNKELLKLLKMNICKKRETDYILGLEEDASYNELPYKIAYDYINKKSYDWNHFWGERGNCNVISTVPYPFERNKFWICRENGIMCRDFLNHNQKRSNGENRSRMKEMLIKIIAKNLGYDEIDASLSFYSLGGNSIHTISIANDINKLSGVETDINEILEADSIDSFCDEIIEKMRRTDIKSENTELSKNTVSKIQRRIYYKSCISRDNRNHVLCHCLKVDQPMNITKVKRVLHQVLNSYEIFRTSFRIQDNDVKSYIHDKCPLDFVELQMKEDDQIDLEEIFEDQFLTGFNVTKVPLIRFVWLAGEKKNYFIVISHKIICDGIAVYNFLEEFFHIYYNNNQPGSRLEYKNCITKQNTLTRNEVAQFCKSLPFNPPKPLYIGGNIEQISYQIPQITYEKIICFLTKNKIGLLSLIILVVAESLCELANERKFLMGVILSGRSNTSYARVIGPMSNLLPIYLCLDLAKSFKYQLAKIEEQIMTLRKNEMIYLEDIYKETSINYFRYMSCIFNLVYSDMKGLDRYKVSQIPVRRKSTDVGMNIDIYIHKQTMEVNFVYRKNLFDFSKDVFEKKLFMHVQEELL